MEPRTERDVDQEPYSQGKSDKRRKKRRVIEVWNKNELVSVDETDYGVFEFLRSASEKRPKGVHKPRIGTALRRDCPIEYSTAGKQKRICGLNISSRNFSLGLLEKASCLSALKTFRAHTSSLEFLPPSIGSWQNLEVLDLTGNSLLYLPKEIGNLSNLRTLSLRGNRISWLPASIGSLQKLDKLDISCNRLEDLPRNIGTAVNLKKLQLEDNKLRSLPTSIGSLQKLEELDLTNNHLQDLPHEIGGLKNLKRLELYGNEELRSLPRSIGHLKALEYLRVTETALTEVMLYNICELSGLQRLDGWVTARGSFLEALLDQIMERGVIQDFIDNGFTVIISRIDDKCRVTNLELNSPHLFCEVPSSLGDLNNLKSLRINRGLNLPTAIGKLQHLERIALCECQLRPSLPSQIGDLSSLRDFEIRDCQTLQFLPPSIGRLKSLERLILLKVPNMSQLPSEELRRLKILTIWRTSISSLPLPFYDSSTLKKLTVDFFHESIAYLQNLTHLVLFDAKDLSDFPKVIGYMYNLRILELNNSPIPSCIGQLDIERFEVCRSDDLKTLPDEIADLGRLKYLSLKNLGGMEILPSCIFRLKNLEHLCIQNMSNLSIIPDEIDNLSNLKSLELHGLGLSALPHSIGLLKNLEYISASKLGSLPTFPEEILHTLARNKARKRMGSMTALMNSKMWPRFIEHAGRAFEFDKRDSDNKLHMNWSHPTSVYQLLVAGRGSFVAAIANRNTLGKRKR